MSGYAGSCFYLCLAVVFIGVSEGLTVDEEPCWSSYGGNCIDSTRSYCPSSNLRTGKCPSQANAIKCCIPFQETECGNVGGVCQRTDKTCSGDYFTGYCPKQPSTVKCCKQTVNKKLIAVDPGHGGRALGAVSADGIREKDLNLKTALKLKTELENKGYTVKLTRSTDVDISLNRRAEMANSWDADLFVSIHYNSATNTGAYGMEVYSYPGSTTGKNLATLTAAEITKTTEARNRNLLGPKEANFVVLRETSMTAMLVEGGFMSNVAEMRKLKDDHYLGLIAKGVANGVKTYLG